MFTESADTVYLVAGPVDEPAPGAPVGPRVPTPGFLVMEPPAEFTDSNAYPYVMPSGGDLAAALYALVNGATYNGVTVTGGTVTQIAPVQTDVTPAPPATDTGTTTTSSGTGTDTGTASGTAATASPATGDAPAS